MLWIAALLAILTVGCQTARPPDASVRGSSVEAIKTRGLLKVGVRQDLIRFGYLEPMTNGWDGFEVAIARDMAAALLGDGGRIELVRVTATQRLPYLRDGTVDLVVAQLGPAPGGDIELSETYFVGGVGVLLRRDRPASSVDDLAAPICAVKRSRALDRLSARLPTAGTMLVDTPTECLLALEGGLVGAAVGEIPALVGLAVQSPAVVVAPFRLQDEPLGIGVPAGQTDLREAVNDTLRRIKSSGRWAALYRQYFGGILPDVAPPA